MIIEREWKEDSIKSLDALIKKISSGSEEVKKELQDLKSFKICSVKPTTLMMHERIEVEGELPQ